MKSLFRTCWVGAVALLFGALPLFAQPQPQAPDQPVFAGVTQYSLSTEAGLAFPRFSEAFYQNELFLLGEAHGVARTQELDLALLQHLHAAAGVQVYVAEVDCAKAYYLNEYLRTGNEATLNLIFRSWQADESQWANQELRAKLVRLQAWNQTLPAARRLRFIGPDQLQDLPLAADYLQVLRAGQRLPAPMKQPLDSLHAALRTNAAQVPALAARSLATLEKSQVARPTANRESLRQLLRSAAQTRTSMSQRERNIFENFVAEYQGQQLAGQKLYGFWGLAHVLQSPLESGFRPFAALVRQSSLPLSQKIASVLCVFADCQMLLPTSFLPAPWQQAGKVYSVSDKFGHDGPLTVLTGMDELKSRTQPGATTLFDLTAAGAATTRQPIGVRYAAGVPAGQQVRFRAALPATEYVQYLVLVRNSGPVHALPQ